MFEGYIVQGVTSDGTLYVGCNVFHRAEVERFASVLGILPETATVAATQEPS